MISVSSLGSIAARSAGRDAIAHGSRDDPLLQKNTERYRWAYKAAEIGEVKNVTPRKPEPYVPLGLDRASYLQGVWDARFEEAERNYWRERGYHIDKTTGKLIALSDAAR